MTDDRSRPEGSNISALRVLVVDDDDDQRMAVVEMFRHAGALDIAQAADGGEAIAVGSATQPDLVVLDLAMPGRSGFDVLPELASALPSAAIVVLSNFPRRRLLAQVERRGAVGFVEKRVPPDRLVAEIVMAAALTDAAARHVLPLAADVHAPRVGRRFVSELLGEEDRALAGDVALLVSELITNAVLHTGTEPRLEVRMSDDAIRVEVFDADASHPHRRAPDVDRPGGRGLHIIDRVATRWGTRDVTGGKVVWFEMLRPRPARPL